MKCSILNRNILITLTLVLIHTYRVSAQDTIKNTIDSFQPNVTANLNDKTYKLNYKQLIAPTVFIGYGIVSLESDGLKQLNFSTREEITEHKPDHIRLDNYTQYAPAVLVFGLNAAGIKGKHNFKDRSIIYITSQLISAAFVVPLKHIIEEERPDESNTFSFPSGHTSTAFSSAQFMFREYKDSHLLLSLSGYPLAVFTGIYRTLNDKHWVGDVVAGAGFGILSTELAYWLYPKVKYVFNKRSRATSTTMMPFYGNKSMGITLVKMF